MSILDWTIVIIPIFIVLFFGIKACRLATSVADFLAARRVAGRYLLCVANLEAGQGLVSLVSMWEMYFVSGFEFPNSTFMLILLNPFINADEIIS